VHHLPGPRDDGLLIWIEERKGNAVVDPDEAKRGGNADDQDKCRGPGVPADERRYRERRSTGWKLRDGPPLGDHY
jgi:hypothetical protein